MRQLRGLVALSVLFDYATAAGGFRKPIAEIDVADVSQPYRASYQVYPFLAGIKLEFLGENRVALSSLDDKGLPKDGLMPRVSFHLTIDVFDVQAPILKAAAQLRFETETSDSSIAALPSGRLVVNTGRMVRVIDTNLRKVAEATAEQVCDMSSEPDQTIAYRVFLYSSSEKIGFIGFAKPWYFAIGKHFPTVGQSCWFSTEDLSPVAKTNAGVVLGGGTAKDLLYYGGPFSLSPKGRADLTFPKVGSCAGDGQLPDFHLLHAESAAELKCKPGSVSIIRGDTVTHLRIPGSKRWDIGPDAWNAPLAIFFGGGVYAPMFGGGATGHPNIRLLNYDSGLSVDLPGPKGSVTARRVFALSPSGQRLAILDGSILSVYEVPQKLFGKSAHTHSLFFRSPIHATIR